MSGGWGSAVDWYSYSRKTQPWNSYEVVSSNDDSVTYSVTGYARSGNGTGYYTAAGYTATVEIFYKIGNGAWHSLGKTAEKLNYGTPVGKITNTVTIDRTASAQSVTFATDATNSTYWPLATAQNSTTVDAHPTYAPSAPSNVTAAFSGNKIVVKWKNNASTWATYSSIELQVQKSGGAWSNVSTSISGSSTSYSYPASGSVDSTAYYAFRVRAKNSKGSSSYATSSVLWGTPSAPSSVTISKLSSTSVLVSASGNWSTGAVIDVSITVNGASGYSSVSGSSVPTQGAFSYTFSGLPSGATVRALVRQRFATPGNASSWVSSEEIKLALPPSGATDTVSDGYLIDKTANVRIWFDDDSEEAPRSGWAFSLSYADAQSQYDDVLIGEVLLPASEVTSGTDTLVRFPFTFQDAGRSFIVRVAARGDGGMSSYVPVGSILHGPLPASGVSADISCGWSSELGYHVNVTVSAPFDDNYKPRMIVAAQQSSGLSAIVKDTGSAGAAFANGSFSYVNSYDEEEKIVWADAGETYYVTFKYGDNLSQSFELTLGSQIRQAWHVPSVSFGPQKTVNGIWVMPVLFDAAKIDDVERASRYEISFEPSGYGLTPESVDDVGEQSYELDKPFSVAGVPVSATVVATGGDGWSSGMPVTTTIPYEFFSPNLKPPTISEVYIGPRGDAEIMIGPVADNGRPFLTTIEGVDYSGYEYLLYVDDELAANFEVGQSTAIPVIPVVDDGKVYFEDDIPHDQRMFSFYLDIKSPWKKSLYVVAVDGDGASARSGFVSVSYVPVDVGIYVAGSDVAISDCLVSEFPTALRLSKSAVEVSSSDLSYNGQKYMMDDGDSIISEFGVR